MMLALKVHLCKHWQCFHLCCTLEPSSALNGHSHGIEVAGTCVTFCSCLDLQVSPLQFRLKYHPKYALHIGVLVHVCMVKAFNFYFWSVKILPINRFKKMNRD
uniref:Uncharacterized protein n=1 Tax=Ixodes ricinus TaxID=34613 RepID=A0A6B0UFL7_IXORI